MKISEFEAWAENQGYAKLTTSDLIRHDDHLFTFSPFEDLEDQYSKAARFPKGFKVQPCFRNVYPQNLYNPLSTPLQTLVSLHVFDYRNSLDDLLTAVYDLLGQQPNVTQANIFFIIPDLESVQRLFANRVSDHNIIRIPEARLRCHLPFAGDHYYIKISYWYKGGLVTIANFVLVNFSGEGFQLDSVLYPERLAMIANDGNFLYDLPTLRGAKAAFYEQIAQSAPLLNFTIGNLRAIAALSEVITPGNNGHGYSLKKIQRELFRAYTSGSWDFIAMINIFVTSGVIASTVGNDLVKWFKTYQRQYQANLKAAKRYLRRLSAVDARELDHLRETYGVELADIRSICSDLNIAGEISEPTVPQHFAFHFDQRLNQFTDPKAQYR